ncbi:hypothetical protein Lal_00036044, partial [Lupinus albus]
KTLNYTWKGAARTQAPIATNYDVSSTTWVDFRITPHLSAMEAIVLHDQLLTPSSFQYHNTLSVMFYCQVLHHGYPMLQQVPLILLLH